MVKIPSCEMLISSPHGIGYCGSPAYVIGGMCGTDTIFALCHLHDLDLFLKMDNYVVHKIFKQCNCEVKQ